MEAGEGVSDEDEVEVDGGVEMREAAGAVAAVGAGDTEADFTSACDVLTAEDEDEEAEEDAGAGEAEAVESVEGGGGMANGVTGTNRCAFTLCFSSATASLRYTITVKIERSSSLRTKLASQCGAKPAL